MMIDIDHVSFQYSGAEQENLQDFNLQIKKKKGGGGGSVLLLLANLDVERLV